MKEEKGRVLSVAGSVGYGVFGYEEGKVELNV